MARAALKLITIHIRLSEHLSTRPDYRSPAANEATNNGRAIHNWLAWREGGNDPEKSVACAPQLASLTPGDSSRRNFQLVTNPSRPSDREGKSNLPDQQPVFGSVIEA
jgi:hypothetical protein